jgi:hypothetical protein
MMPLLPRPAAWILPALLVSGCAAQGTFPSLQPREVERNVSTEEPVREQIFVQSDPALRGRAAELLALARRGESEFESAYGRASTAAARAGAPGTESWLVAQQAISRVEAARDETTRALAELDALEVARAGQPTNSDDFAAVHAAAQEAQRISESQHARLARLRAAVGPG